MKKHILVIGANGQIGCELVAALSKRHGNSQVFAADISAENKYGAANYHVLDVLNPEQIASLVEQHHITEIYHLAAMLSVTGEASPMAAWTLNVTGLLNILELAKKYCAANRSLRVFWPSSIAAFGPHTPLDFTPQTTIMDPSTIYGISKLAGERLCEYYFTQYGVDVRSVRYPGIISYQSPPGGGTTDYAIAIFHAAISGEPYTCYLKENTQLPMMYMPDAIAATLQLMEAPSDRVRIRSAYNIAGISFTPADIAAAIKVYYPDFRVAYAPDKRQAIADSWPRSIDDREAQLDWGWQSQYDLKKMVSDMVKHMDIHTMMA